MSLALQDFVTGRLTCQPRPRGPAAACPVKQGVPILAATEDVRKLYAFDKVNLLGPDDLDLVVGPATALTSLLPAPQPLVLWLNSLTAVARMKPVLAACRR